VGASKDLDQAKQKGQRSWQTPPANDVFSHTFASLRHPAQPL
jgi:hypothetical protein